MFNEDGDAGDEEGNEGSVGHSVLGVHEACDIELAEGLKVLGSQDLNEVDVSGEGKGGVVGAQHAPARELLEGDTKRMLLRQLVGASGVAHNRVRQRAVVFCLHGEKKM